MRILTGGSIASMCAACRRGTMSAGPDGFRDPAPNNFAASKAGTLIGFSGSSVRPIVISFSSFIPALTRVYGDDRRTLVPPRASSWPMPHGPSRCSITPEAPRLLDRLEFGEIEFDNRPQSVGEHTVVLVVRQRFQPAG